MFDSNVFDKLPEFIDRVKNSAGSQYEYYITSIQVEELCEIPDDKQNIRKTNILMLVELRAKLVPISVFILNGRTRLGYARLGNGEVYRKILNDKKTNIDDAVIADTAVYEGCTLVTQDKDLYKKMKNNNYDVMYLEEFLDSFKS
jgi:predicted nucleic acid-binding protein